MQHYKPYRYFAHLAVWMALILLYVYPLLKAGLSSPMTTKWTLVKYVLYGLINFQLFYLLVFIVLPGVVKRRQYLRVAGYTVAAILLFSVLKYIIGYFIFPDQVLFRAIPLMMVSMKHTMISHAKPMTFWEYLPLTIQVGVGVGLLACGYRLFLEWRSVSPEDRLLVITADRARGRFERMQEGSRQLLYNLQQLGPLLEDPDKREKEGTRAMWLLSDLLRYMLYDKALENDKVSFRKELLHYERYLELRSLCNAQRPLTLHITGSEPEGLIEALRLQHITGKRLQQLQDIPGTVLVALHISEDTVSLSVAPEHSSVPVSPEKIKLYPAHA